MYYIYLNMKYSKENGLKHGISSYLIWGSFLNMILSQLRPISQFEPQAQPECQQGSRAVSGQQICS